MAMSDEYQDFNVDEASDLFIIDRFERNLKFSPHEVRRYFLKLVKCNPNLPVKMVLAKINVLMEEWES